jgi:hypothetical protein
MEVFKFKTSQILYSNAGLMKNFISLYSKKTVMVVLLCFAACILVT